ncbi:MAG TPA: Ig-like domain-containing protein [Dermatophilaceae bacterium]
MSSRRGRIYATALVAVCFLLLAFLLLAFLALAGPTVGSPSAAPPGPDSQQASATPTPTPTRAMIPAVLVVSPADQAVAVPPDAPVTVRASSGSVRTVSLVDAKGARVGGRLGTDGTWATSVLLLPSTSYTFDIEAIGPDGMTSSTSSTFRTLEPAVRASYSLIPSGGTVGVGMPVIVQFDSAVSTKARRAEVEKRVRVTTLPAQRGHWGWLDNRRLMWRPEHLWAAGTKVTVSTPLHGVQTGDDKWIMGDDGTTFTVGSAMVSTVDMNAHTMTVRRGGAIIRSFKVSTGKSGPMTETRYGTKVIIERNSAITMDSATVGIPKGDPSYYKIKTEWNLRLTWTGEYIHSAPWSVNSQGTQNVSHGCTNMAPADAEWMFTNSKVGDVVKFTGSSRAFTSAEGIGVWVYSYEDWVSQSALA